MEGTRIMPGIRIDAIRQTRISSLNFRGVRSKPGVGSCFLGLEFIDANRCVASLCRCVASLCRGVASLCRGVCSCVHSEMKN